MRYWPKLFCCYADCRDCAITCCITDKVAVKILDKTKLDAKTQRLLSREISSMERLHHPNVIRLYEVIETLSKLHLVMEYASCGELFTKISNDGRLPESEAKPLFAQIVAAVEHMVVQLFIRSVKSVFEKSIILKLFFFIIVDKSNQNWFY